MAGGYKIVISAADNASGVLDKANKRVEALNKRVTAAQAPFKRLGENFDTFTKVTGLDKIATGFGSVAQAGTEAFRSMARVLEPLAAITGAVSIAGMFRLTEAWGQFATQIGQTAVRAGLSTDSLYNLQNAARLAGVSAETLTSSVTAMNDNMRNAAFGGGATFLATLRNLHLSYDELQKMTPEKRLLVFADALKKVANPTDRALYASNIFGGEGLLPLLAKGANGIENLEKKARSLTGSFSGLTAAMGDQFRQSMTSMSLATEGLGNSLASVLGPALAPTIDLITSAVVHMREWIDANQAWLRGEISAKVGEFVKWLVDVDWKGIGQGIKGIWTDANGVATALGGWKQVGKDVLKFFVATWAVKMLGTIASVIAAIAGLPVAATAAMAQALGVLTFLGYQGAKGSGEQIANAGQLGLQVAGTDEWGNATWYVDGNGHRYSAPEADEMVKAGKLAPGAVPYSPPTPSGSNVSGTGASRPANGIGPNAQYMHDQFRTAGYSEAQTAGMLGHLRGESFRNGDYDPSAFNPDGGGQGAQGIGQWRGPRIDRFREMFGHDPRYGTIQEQTKFMLWELGNTEKASGDKLRSETEAGQAAADMVRLYGRPLPQDLPGEERERSQYGRGWLRMFSPSGDPAPLPSAAPGAAGAPGATGRVDLNVSVAGPGTVRAVTRGDINMNIARPGLIMSPVGG